jgi:hypothetical protein
MLQLMAEDKFVRKAAEKCEQLHGYPVAYAAGPTRGGATTQRIKTYTLNCHVWVHRASGAHRLR